MRNELAAEFDDAVDADGLLQCIIGNVCPTKGTILQYLCSVFRKATPVGNCVYATTCKALRVCYLLRKCTP